MSELKPPDALPNALPDAADALLGTVLAAQANYYWVKLSAELDHSASLVFRCSSMRTC